jgi:hypothetical protein
VARSKTTIIKSKTEEETQVRRKRGERGGERGERREKKYVILE